ncbi:hypothetical protein GGR50DRAFT_318759 [Xylaria sp. CBS 124048]|nr:hypothetical protein GGR50DRAFT_318759 [Xylaria sp. CBS 124048]
MHCKALARVFSIIAALVLAESCHNKHRHYKKLKRRTRIPRSQKSKRKSKNKQQQPQQQQQQQQKTCQTHKKSAKLLPSETPGSSHTCSRHKPRKERRKVFNASRLIVSSSRRRRHCRRHDMTDPQDEEPRRSKAKRYSPSHKGWQTPERKSPLPPVTPKMIRNWAAASAAKLILARQSIQSKPLPRTIPTDRDPMVPRPFKCEPSPLRVYCMNASESHLDDVD